MFIAAETHKYEGVGLLSSVLAFSNKEKADQWCYEKRKEISKRENIGFSKWSSQEHKEDVFWTHPDTQTEIDCVKVVVQ